MLLIRVLSSFLAGEPCNLFWGIAALCQAGCQDNSNRHYVFSHYGRVVFCNTDSVSHTSL